MSIPLILVVTLLYAGVAVCECRAGRYGTALMFFSYGLANVGMIMELVR